MFDLANEEDRMEEFLKLEPSGSIVNNIITNEKKLENGDISASEKLPEEAQNLETNADETEAKATDEEEPKQDSSSKTEEDNVEEEKSQEIDAGNEQVGDTATENSKEEETIREPSPEKAEE